MSSNVILWQGWGCCAAYYYIFGFCNDSLIIKKTTEQIIK